jgi:hypothetical protein
MLPLSKGNYRSWFKGSSHDSTLTPGAGRIISLSPIALEAPLHGGLVALELGEGVRAVAVPDEGEAERRRILVDHTPVALLGEYAGLH